MRIALHHTAPVIPQERPTGAIPHPIHRESTAKYDEANARKPLSARHPLELDVSSLMQVYNL